MNITSILSELVKTRDKVQSAIDDCNTFIDSLENTKETKEKALINETKEKLKHLQSTLEELDEKISKIRGGFH